MIKITDVQIAPTNFMLDIYFGEDIEEIAVQLDRVYDWRFDSGDYSNIISNLKARRGFTDEVYDDDGTIRLVVWVKDKDDLITLGHEIIHITWYIQNFTGMNFSWDSQEIQTYLHDYLYYQILNKLHDANQSDNS